MLEQGLTPQETQGSMRRGDASRTPPRRGRGRPKARSASASRSARSLRGRQRREDEDLQERRQRRRRELEGAVRPDGPAPRSEEEILVRQLQRRQSVRGEAQERGPAPRSDEEELEERQQRRRCAERGEAREAAPRGGGAPGSTAPSPTLARLCRRTTQGPTARGPPRRCQSRRAPTQSRGRAVALPHSPARPTTPLAWRLPATAARKRETGAPP